MTCPQYLKIQKIEVKLRCFDILSGHYTYTYICLGQLPLLHFLCHSAISKVDEQVEAVVRIHPATNRSILDKMTDNCSVLRLVN